MMPVERRKDVLAKVIRSERVASDDTSEYAIFQNLQGEPTFNWWVLYVLKKRDRIILVVMKQSF